MSHHIRLIIFIFLFLVGCVPITEEIATPIASSPIETTRPAATLTNTPKSQNVPWKFFELHDPALPDIVVSSQDGYFLDPQWQVVNIDYVYQWWGLGPPAFDFQSIERQSDGRYMLDDREINSEAVQDLLSAIRQLHPSQSLLEGIGGFDNYPSRSIELTGSDGQRILLISSSTGNPGAGPWNIFGKRPSLRPIHRGNWPSLSQLVYWQRRRPSSFNFLWGARS